MAGEHGHPRSRSAIISLDVYPASSVAGLYARLEASAPGHQAAGRCSTC
jgi:hypothetical protein